MTVTRFAARVRALDARLLRMPRPLQYLVIILTSLVMMATCAPHVPRVFVDYSRIPLLAAVRQPETYGTDTIGAIFAAKVVLNDVSDMYARQKIAQTPLEAATWSPQASAPYPPATLLAFTVLYAAGEWTGVGYYGMVLGVAAAFLILSAWYFLETRWYLFPALYLNFDYFAERFTYVQDGSYLVMLVPVVAGLLLARRGWPGSHALVALGIILKLSPLAHAWNLSVMRRSTRVVFAVIVVAGLVLPVAIWPDYLGIYLFHQDIKGNVYDTLGAVIVTIPMTALLWYVQARRGFDVEERIGWALVPFALFLGIKMRVARHLLIVLLVPDKHGARNLIAAFGLALHVLAPQVFRLGSVLYISTVLLASTLVWQLRVIGWDTVTADMRHLWRERTLRLPALAAPRDRGSLSSAKDTQPAALLG